MIGVRFYNAIEKTRYSINNKLDTIFEGRKQIDEEFLDELEEMLISTDIGVATTMQILEAVRRGVSRQEINDLDALKRIMKDELLEILHHSTERGVADERTIREDIKPYVLMVVGVNGVGKTTTIGKLSQRPTRSGPPRRISWKSGRSAPACRSFSKNRAQTRRRCFSIR
jgi:fused signal recognition particle receptor